MLHLVGGDMGPDLTPSDTIAKSLGFRLAKLTPNLITLKVTVIALGDGEETPLHSVHEVKIPSSRASGEGFASGAGHDDFNVVKFVKLQRVFKSQGRIHTGRSLYKTIICTLDDCQTHLLAPPLGARIDLWPFPIHGNRFQNTIRGVVIVLNNPLRDGNLVLFIL